MNTLYYGDNIEILREHVGDESVDLVYLDPPFKSGQQYSVLFRERNGSRSAAQIKAFEDTWFWDEETEARFEALKESPPDRLARLMQGLDRFLVRRGHGNDMLAYLVMMAQRLVELRRVLKPTGSIYLHCDPTASHYLKLLMDAVFGSDNFLNEIAWCYYTRAMPTTWFARKHDILFFYSKESGGHHFNMDSVRVPYKPESLAQYNRTDEEGRRYKQQSGGKRTYLTPGGRPCPDWWTIQIPGSRDPERLGYPTQKPEALLERIIKASSNEGDVVLDPFCGCGTTVAVAERLKRRWVGIDITHLAVALIRSRLEAAFEGQAEYEVIGEPASVADARALAESDRFEFQRWLVGRVGGCPMEKKTADKGIDGRIYFHDEPKGGETKEIILSVKSGKLKPADLRDLRGVIEREGAQIGVLLTLQEPTSGMRSEAVSAGVYESPWGKHPRLQLLTVHELLQGKSADYPRETNVTFNRAPRARGARPEQGTLL